MVQSDWENEGNSFVLNIEIPKDATAKIILPDDYKNSTVKVIDLESQKPMKVKIENGELITGSGKFEISTI